MADWVSANQNLQGMFGGANRERGRQVANQDALSMMIMKARFDQQAAMNNAIAQKRAEAEIEDEIYKRNIQRARENPNLFLGGPGINPSAAATSTAPAPQATPQRGAGSFNPMQQAPPEFRALLNLSTGKPERVENPEYKQYMDIETTRQKEALKPYSSDEIRIASKTNLIPEVDKLIKLVNEKDVYEGVKMPFGASRISAFGEKGPYQSFKRGMTQFEGREAGLLLGNIKQLMFGEGGSALTDTEISILSGLLNPAYKTEKRWVEDLHKVKEMIITKARMLRTSPGDAINPAASGNSGYVRTGTLPDGRRVGQKADGTTEVIGGQ